MPITKDQLDQLRHLLRPLATRVANTVARAVVNLVDDSKKMQLVQLGVLADEPVAGASGAGCEHFQPYGFFSVPFPGAEAVVIFPNGDRTHPLVVAVSDRRYRPTSGKPGEVGLRTDEGDEIRLARGHAIVLTTSGQIQLGGAGAASPAVLGDKQLDALGKLVTAIATAVSGIPGGSAAGAAINTALAAFQSAALSFLSARVKLE